MCFLHAPNKNVFATSGVYSVTGSGPDAGDPAGQGRQVSGLLELPFKGSFKKTDHCGLSSPVPDAAHPSSSVLPVGM